MLSLLSVIEGREARAILGAALVVLAFLQAGSASAGQRRPQSAVQPTGEGEHASMAAIDAAGVSAEKIADELKSALVLSRVAIATWTHNEAVARKLFERAVAKARGITDAERKEEAERGVDAILLSYGRLDIERARVLADDSGASESLSSSASEARARVLVGVALETVEVDSTRSAELVRASIQGGVIDPKVADVMARLPLAQRHGLMSDVLRVAATSDSVSFLTLIGLATRSELIEFTTPVSLGKAGSADIVGLWLTALTHYLEFASSELRASKLGNRVSALDVEELRGVAEMCELLLECYERFLPTQRSVALALVTGIVSQAPSAAVPVSDLMKSLSEGRSLGPDALLDRADVTRDRREADFLRQFAIYQIAADAGRSERRRSIRLALARISQPEIRERTGDVAWLGIAAEFTRARSWPEVVEYTSLFSRADLRAEVCGAVSLVAAEKGQKSVVFSFVTDLRRESKYATTSLRTARGLLLGSLAALNSGDTQTAFELFDMSLEVVDRYDEQKAVEPTVFGFWKDVRFGSVAIQPNRSFDLETLPWVSTMRGLASQDLERLKYAVYSLSSSEQRAVALLAFADVASSSQPKAAVGSADQ